MVLQCSFMIKRKSLILTLSHSITLIQKRSSRTFTGSVHFKPNTYKNAKSQSIGAEPGLEPESEAAYPGALPHYPDYAILHHFYAHTHVFTVKIRIIIQINTINQ